MLLLTIITGSFFVFVACDSEEVSQPVGNPIVKFQPAVTTVDGVKVTTKYADGTYTIDTPYGTPGGDSSITVSVVLKDDTIQSLNVVGNATGGTIQRYQSFFIDGVKSEVVGKKLDSVKVGVVNGASLTSNAFNNAISSVVAGSAKK